MEATRYCTTQSGHITMAHLEELNANVINTMEMFIPQRVYGKNPRGLMPSSDVYHKDSVIQSRMLMNVFGYLAVKASESYMAPAEEGETTRTRIQSKNSISVTWERVGSATMSISSTKETPTDAVGFRLRITEHCSEGYNMGLAASLQQLVKSNEEREQKKLTSSGTPFRNAPIDACSHLLVTSTVWGSLCLFYAGKQQASAELQYDRSQSLSHATNPRNPINVFTIERSLEFAKNMKAHAMFVDPLVYTQFHVQSANPRTTRAFARIDMIHILSVSDIHPAHMPSRILPHIRPSLIGNDTARRAYDEQFGAGSSAHFESNCSRTCEAEGQNDMEAITRHIAREKAELRQQYPAVQGVVTNAYVRALKEKKIEWNHNIAQIISPEGDAPPAIKKLAAFRDEYLERNNKSFCIPRRHNMKNLSRFEDAWATHLAVFKTIFTVKSAFRMCVVLLMSSLHVFRRVPTNPHALLLGPPGIGKSFALLLLKDLLVPGTWILLSNMTAKALHVPGKINDSLIMIFEDAPSTLLGVSAGQRNSNAASTDQENMMKQFMTSMKATTQTIVMDPKRAGETITGDCCCTCFFAMNDDSSNFPAAILSRLNVHIASEDTTPETMGATLPQYIARSSKPSVAAAMKDSHIWWHRVQVLMMEIFHRVAAGCIMDITMEAADCIFTLVANQMKSKYKNDSMSNPRKFSRFRAILASVVLLDVIGLLWDSPASPFADRPHQETDFLEVEKHLVATKAHAIFTLGLLSNEFQEDIKNHIIGTMKKLFFAHAEGEITLRDMGTDIGDDEAPPLAPNGVYIPDIGPHMNERSRAQLDAPGVRDYINRRGEYDMRRENDANWHSTCHAYGSSALPQPVGRNNVVQPEDVIEQIVTVLMVHLQPRPLKREVAGALNSLRNLLVLETRTVTKDGVTSVESKTIPALVIDKTCIRMAHTTLRTAGVSDMLFDCTRDVAEALLNSGGDSGTGGDTMSYIWGDIQNNGICRQITVGKRSADELRAKGVDLNVWTPGFYDSILVEQASSFIGSIRKGVDTSMDDLFATGPPCMYIDADIDEHATLLRASMLHLTHAEQQSPPSMDKQKVEKCLFAYWADNNDRQHQYPHEYVDTSSQQYKKKLETEKIRNPRYFSMAAKMEHMKLQQNNKRMREFESERETKRAREEEQNARRMHDEQQMEYDEQEQMQRDDNARLEQEIQDADEF